MLEDDVQEPLWLACLRGERASFYDILEQGRKGKIDLLALTGGGPPQLGFLLGLTSRGAQIYGLKHYQKIIEASQLPPNEWYAELKRVEAELRRDFHVVPPLARLLLPAVNKVAEAILRVQASMRCAIATLAVERYRGAWPLAGIAGRRAYCKGSASIPTGRPL